MAIAAGFVEKIKYRSGESGYSILSVSNGGEEYILVGTFHHINEGEMIEATGTMTEYPIYGEQLSVKTYEIKAPEDTLSTERYLGSGAIKGVGTTLTARVVRRFKADTFRIIEEEPERPSEVKDISEKTAIAIFAQMDEKKEMRQAMMFLQEYGISMNLAVKIYQEYGPKLYGIIKENPYRLADDIAGIGFKITDEIAEKVGIFAGPDFRIRSGILYILLQASVQEYTYLPKEELLTQAADLLKVDLSAMDEHLMDMQINKRLIAKESDSACVVYATVYYYTELNVVKMLHDLDIHGTGQEEKIRTRLKQIQDEEDIELDDLQIQAVVEAVSSGLLTITGGPGTGKTTTINAMIRYFEQEEMETLLAVPTGRAAKRMTEATGYEARTIHRLLELPGVLGGQGSVGMHFGRNEENPLDADAIIIDEMSMVDIQPMQSLLKAVSVGTRLILVGDVNQLPSVGPGSVLHDIINSGCFNVVKLTKIFRQALESDIIVSAHRINRGETMDLGKRSNDFLFIRRDSPDAIVSAMITLMKEKLPGYVHVSPFDIQIMMLMRKGALGVECLNGILQGYLNPPDKSKLERESGGAVFRVGDKVMQIRNNYQIEQEVRNKYGIPLDSGMGVSNSDMGIIKEMNMFAEMTTAEFDEGRMVEHSFRQLGELELAYAITTHKSQGGEYPAVVIPVHFGPRMLMTKNLIYIAVARARSCVCLIGIPETFQAMVDNQMEQWGYSGLKERIQEFNV